MTKPKPPAPEPATGWGPASGAGNRLHYFRSTGHSLCGRAVRSLEGGLEERKPLPGADCGKCISKLLLQRQKEQQRLTSRQCRGCKKRFPKAAVFRVPLPKGLLVLCQPCGATVFGELSRTNKEVTAASHSL